MKIETKKYFKFIVEIEGCIGESQLINKMKEYQNLYFTDLDDYVSELFNDLTSMIDYEDLSIEDKESFETLIINDYRYLLPKQFKPESEWN